MAGAKKKESGRTRLTSAEALELRLLEFQVATARAGLEHITAIRNERAVAIAKAHGIDVQQGSWHIDADAGHIEPRPEG